MAEFLSLARVSEIQPSQGKTIMVGEKKIAVFNVGGNFYAMDGTCVHRGGPLGEGILEGCIVTCPWHGLNPALHPKVAQSRSLTLRL